MSQHDRLTNLEGDRPAALFAVDADWDRQAASDGRSRFGVYLRLHRPILADLAEEHVLDVAAQVWRIAQAPVITPGYVASASRVTENDLYRDEIAQPDGGCNWGLRAKLVVAYHCPIAGWSDWQRNLDGSWYPPADERRPHALCRITYCSPLSLQTEDFGSMPDLGNEASFLRWANRAVATVTARMNEVFGPLTGTVALKALVPQPDRQPASAVIRWADDPLGPDPPAAPDQRRPTRDL